MAIEILERSRLNGSVPQSELLLNGQKSRMPSGKLTGAEATVLSLLDIGAEVAFGIPGGAIMPFYDALGYYPELRHILMRHEQGAAHAAEGYGRRMGKAGLVVATSGPGATNLVTGLGNAYADRVALVALTGQVPTGMIGKEAFQEVDIISITKPVVKWSYQVRDPYEIPGVIARAYAEAESGRQGPVLVDVPKDAQFKSMEQYIHEDRPFIPEPDMNSEVIAQLQQAARLINENEEVLILVGHGVALSHAEEELLALAEKADIPVAHTLHGVSEFPPGHGLDVGMVGMHGTVGANMQTNEAKVLIVIGARLDDRVIGDGTKYAKQARIVHIDNDPRQFERHEEKNLDVELSINADAKAALSVLLENIEPRKRQAWVEQFRQYERQEEEEVWRNALSPNTHDYKMTEFLYELYRRLPFNSTVVADVGQHQMAAAQLHRIRRPKSYLTTGGFGTMGYSLPAAIGVQVAAPEDLVVVVVGDGSFQMTSQELIIAKQEGLPIKVAILNNRYLGMVRQWQELFHAGMYSQTHLENPNFIKLGEASYIPGERVRRPLGWRRSLDNAARALHLPIHRVTDYKDLGSAVYRFISSKGPTILEVFSKQEENIWPMVPSGGGPSDVRTR